MTDPARRNFIRTAGGLILFTPFFPLAGRAQAKNIMDNQPITIQLGQTGQGFTLLRGGGRMEIQREPAGVNFYTISWSMSSLGVIRVSHGTYSFTLAGALSCMGIEDLDFPAEGIAEFHFDVAPAVPAVISHLEARDRIFRLLHMLQMAGWRRYIDRHKPRFSGKTALEESIQRWGAYCLDPNYVPTLPEWMRLMIGSYWGFYAEGAYLTIEFKRDSRRMDPDKPGAYLVSFTLKNELVYMRGLFKQEKRKHWQEFWPEQEKYFQLERAEAEAKARAQGLSIDTTYTDPPILALKRHTSP